MTTAIILSVFVVLPAAAVAVALAWSIRAARQPDPPWLQQVLRTRVLVQIASGETVDGLLVDADEHGLLVEPARVEDRDVAGQVWIPRDGVRWVQRTPLPRS